MIGSSEEQYRIDDQNVALPDERKILKKHLPKHVAIIMDGNGRWAKSKGQDRIAGHQAGAETVRMLVEDSRRLGIENLTLFAFSTENWERPAEEVAALMQLFRQYLNLQLDLMCKNGIILKVIGQRERLPDDLRETIEKVENSTVEAAVLFKKNNPSIKTMNLLLAVSYGGRSEIVDACKSFAGDVLAGRKEISELNEKTFNQYLYTSEIPDPDLLIRTSNEFRISNFLLWQLAYTEIYVTETNWPEFMIANYLDALYSYSIRERRFGLV